MSVVNRKNCKKVWYKLGKTDYRKHNFSNSTTKVASESF